MRLRWSAAHIYAAWPLLITQSFNTSLRIEWPNIFKTLTASVGFLSIKFLRLPKAACTTPNYSFFSSFDGITCGIVGFTVYIGLLWLLGRFILTRRGHSVHIMRKFDRLMVARLIVFLTLVFSPATARAFACTQPAQPSHCWRLGCLAQRLHSPCEVCRVLPWPCFPPSCQETIMGVFSCREVNGVWYLSDDMAVVCYEGTHLRYFYVGIFWALLIPLGIPCLYLGLMCYYRLPWVARELTDIAYLRQLIDAAHHHHVLHPDTITRCAPRGMREGPGCAPGPAAHSCAVAPCRRIAVGAWRPAGASSGAVRCMLPRRAGAAGHGRGEHK